MIHWQIIKSMHSVYIQLLGQNLEARPASLVKKSWFPTTNYQLNTKVKISQIDLGHTIWAFMSPYIIQHWQTCLLRACNKLFPLLVLAFNSICIKQIKFWTIARICFTSISYAGYIDLLKANTIYSFKK